MRTSSVSLHWSYVLPLILVLTDCDPHGCRNKPPDPPVVECPKPFFELIGDLEGDAHYSELRDIDRMGLRSVGESWANDTAIADDGGSTWAGTGTWAHAYQAIGFTRLCANVPFLSAGSAGLQGLGYCAPTWRSESAANGVSPDGDLTVGCCNAGATGMSQAMTLRSDLNKTLLPALAGDQSGMARASSDTVRTLPGGGPGAMDAVRSGERVIVGHSSSSTDIPQKRVGGKAVIWTSATQVVPLPLPMQLPNGLAVISSEAIAISDDGWVVVGNLFFDGPAVSGARLPCYPCVWHLQSNGAFSAPVFLGVLPGEQPDGKVQDVSGDGRVVVGTSQVGEDAHACRWTFDGASWSTALELGVLPGMTYSTVGSVNRDGSAIVGTSGFFSDDAFGFRPVRWRPSATSSRMEDLHPVLAALVPSMNITDDWLISIAAISGEGATACGTVSFPSPTPADPDRRFDEGWVAGPLP